MESSVVVLAQGNGSEDTACVGVGALVTETLDSGQGEHLEIPPPP